MASSNIDIYEKSQQDGQPIELYRFTHGDMNYFYTSHAEDVSIVYTVNGITRTETYFADYVDRESFKPATKGSAASLTVSVSKDNPVAMLYMGPPPETPISMSLIRLHRQDNTKYDQVFWGNVSQAAFENSECNLTIKLENWMEKEVPKGKRQFTCNNVIFDDGCMLNKENYRVPFFIDQAAGTKVQSTTFSLYPDGYFTGGVIDHGENSRMVAKHQGDSVWLRYPFPSTPRNDATIVPGCDGLFETCAIKYQNHLNFFGFPYVPPANPEKKNVGRGVYWVDSQVVQRDTDGFVGSISL